MHTRVCRLHPFKYVTSDPKCQQSCQMCDNHCTSHKFQSQHQSFEIDSLIMSVHQQREKFLTMPSSYVKNIQKMTDAYIKKLQDSKNKCITRINKVTEFYRQRAKARQKIYPNLDQKILMLERKRIEQLKCCDIDIIINYINIEQLEEELALIFEQFKKDKLFMRHESMNLSELREKHYKEMTETLTQSFTKKFSQFQESFSQMQEKNVELELKIREKTRKCNELEVLLEIMNKREKSEKPKRKQIKKPKPKPKHKPASTKLKENTKRLITNHIQAHQILQKHSVSSEQLHSMSQQQQYKEKSGHQKGHSQSVVEKDHQKSVQEDNQKKVNENAAQDKTPRKAKMEVFEYNPSIQRESKIPNRQINHHKSPPVLKISRDVEFIHAKHQYSPIKQESNHANQQKNSFKDATERIDTSPIKLSEAFIPEKNYQNIKAFNSSSLTPGIQYNINTENSNLILSHDKNPQLPKKIEEPKDGVQSKFPIKRNQDELGFSDESQEFKDFPENRKALWQSEMPDQFYVKNFKK